MRMLRRTTLLGTLGLTAVFGLAQVGAAVFLIRRFEQYRPFSAAERVLWVGLALLLAAAEMLTAIGGVGSDS